MKTYTTVNFGKDEIGEDLGGQNGKCEYKRKKQIQPHHRHHEMKMLQLIHSTPNQNALTEPEIPVIAADLHSSYCYCSFVSCSNVTMLCTLSINLSFYSSILFYFYHFLIIKIQLFTFSFQPILVILISTLCWKTKLNSFSLKYWHVF